MISAPGRGAVSVRTITSTETHFLYALSHAAVAAITVAVFHDAPLTPRAIASDVMVVTLATLWFGLWVGARAGGHQTTIGMDAATNFGTIAAAAFAGLLWGGAAAILFPLGSTPQQLYLIAVTTGLVAGAAVTGTHPPAARLAYAVGAAVPPLGALVIDGGAMHWAAAGLGAFAIFILRRLARASRPNEAACASAGSDLLADMVDSVDQGLIVIDTALVILASNAAAARILDLPQALLTPGASFEAVIRHAARRGDYGDGDPDALAAQYRALASGEDAHRLERILPNGTAIEIRGNPMPGGGFVISYTDVTELMRTAQALRQSEERLSRIADNLPGTVYRRVMDPDGRVSYPFVSAASRELYGLEPEAIIADAEIMFAAVHPDDCDAFRAAIATSGERLEPYDHEFRVIKAGGQINTIRSLARPHRTKDGSIVWDGITLDVTEHRRTRQAEIEHRAKLDAIVRSVPDALMLASTDRTIVVANPGVTRIFGYDIDEIVGMKTTVLYENPEDHTTQGQIRFNTDATELLEPYVVKYRRKDGTVFPGESVGSIVRDEDGTVVGFLGLIRDVTDRQRFEDALRATKEEAELANRSKSEFLANMSHELRTPLNAIIGFSEILSNELMGPIGRQQYKEYASDIHHSGTHLLALINDILDLSKIEAGKSDLQPEIIALGDIVVSALRIVHERATDAGVRLETETPPDLPPLFADERAMKQILLNLLSNAIKFTPAEGCVTVRTEIDDTGGINLSVSDTGIGIAEEDIPTAMTPFRQVDNSLSRKYEGTGLGLPLVRSLAELHEGRLELTSTVGIGTTATVHFPASRVVSESRESG